MTDSEYDTLPDDERLKTSIIPGDRYEIRGFLGSGGFAEVYEGYDSLIQRPVAIKIMNSVVGIGSAKHAEVMLERFNREARTAAAIRHPNVVAIYDMGVLDKKRPYIVMEKLEGHDLEGELEKHGGMAPARLLPLFARALDALGEGHRQGIVHKDLKPANLFLVHPGTDREDIRVVDFGIARIGGADAALTGTGQILGTPRYIAPEYAQTQAATPAVDVYQMGLILVELLTGSPVVDSDNAMKCLMTHATGDLNVSLDLLDSPLGHIIAKALLHDPEGRFDNASEFKTALLTISPDTLPASFAVATAKQSMDEVSASHRQVAANPSSGPDTGHHGLGRSGGMVSDNRGRVSIKEYVSKTGVLSKARPQTQPARQRAAPATAQVSDRPPEGDTRTSGSPLKAVFVALAVLLLIAGLAAGGIAGFKFLGKGKKPTTRPKAAVASKTVTLVVRSDPSRAEVKQKGKTLGKTPFEVTFKAGDKKTRKLTLEKKGYEPKEISLKPGQDPPETIELKKKPQTISLKSDPSRAEVKQDGKTLGKTPFEVTFEDGDKKSRKLTIEKKGYKAKRVIIKPSQDSPRTITLEQEAQVITLKSDPSGAEVKQGNKSLGVTPFEVTFEAGDSAPREFVIKKKGHKAKKVTLDPGQDPPSTIKLEKAAARKTAPVRVDKRRDPGPGI